MHVTLHVCVYVLSYTPLPGTSVTLCLCVYVRLCGQTSLPITFVTLCLTVCVCLCACVCAAPDYPVHHICM